ncbi:hypothetical protein POM88_031490 [Heracleum sosnowskyi]|uniref:Uncharacterized protein n=1 Tax=Heracleum sosnowskyi TaxID=360622 RepID=A0AAD8HZI5_9APIA|nr:hypothetical protein POM88_031490 [Heracleum sosnowskyi]
MSLAFRAFRVTPASSFICLYNGRRFYPITGFQMNFGFVNKNNFLRPSGLRFETNQRSSSLKSAQSLACICCDWRIWFSSVAASYGAASSFNYSIGDFENCKRMGGLELKEAANDDGSHTNVGFGHGNSDSRGGGDNSGSDSGGLDDSADWEGVRWFCWRIFQAWTDYNNSTNLISSEAAISRVGSILVNIEGCLKKMAEPNFESCSLRWIIGRGINVGLCSSSANLVLVVLTA